MTEKELRALLDSMTIEEKLGELWQPQQLVYDKDGVLTGAADTNTYTPEEIYRSGSTLNLFGIDRIRKVQEEHIKNNPHHIPLLFMGDICRGFSTIFPITLGYSCSFDLELIKKAYRVVAKESAASGFHITFYPAMDLVRDPRWGRVVESAGEDPYLASKICAAMVEGLQGDGLDKPDTIGACVKHFAGYGGAEGGRDYNTVELSERTLRQYYLPGYKGGIDAGASMVMTSYNAIGGVPSNCNKHLVRDILRGEWGWDGVVITDLWATSSMTSHRIGDDINDEKYQAEVSLEAGIDIEMGSCQFRWLADSIKEGKIDEKLVDEACYRVLKLKNDLGLFENPFREMSEENAEKLLKCDEHLDIAKKLSTESCVLLKNEDNALPLTEKSGKIAFIGPFVDLSTTSGGAWVLTNDDESGSLHNVVNKHYPGNDFIFAKGCSGLGREQVRESKRFSQYSDEQNREKDISEAVNIAKKVDTVVLALGECPGMFGEAKSRANIRIPDVQLELYRRVRAVNENVIVLVFNGRPLDLSEINDAKAILDVWYLGTMMSEAVTNLIFGKESPSGKLTMSFPSFVGQIPVYYNKLPTDHRKEPYWSEYIDDSSSNPLYPFGHGLNYTTLKYGKTVFSKERFTPDETITASVEITNTGDRDCCEIVQLYIRDFRATVSRPIKELKGFKRVDIKAGETVTVQFEINEEMLRYFNIDMEYVSDAGRFDAIIATSSAFEEDEMLPFYLDK